MFFNKGHHHIFGLKYSNSDQQHINCTQQSKGYFIVKHGLTPEIRAFAYEQRVNTTFCLLFSKIKIFRVQFFLLLEVQLCFRRFFPFEALFLKRDYLFMIQSTVYD